MSATGNDLRRWRPSSWFLAVALVAGGELALIYGLSSNQIVPLGRVRPSTRVHVNPTQEDESSASLAQGDPTLFALATPEGFSSRAWMSVPRFAYRMTNSPEAPEWLNAPTEELGGDFEDFLQTNLVAEQPDAGRLAPRLTPIRLAKPVVIPGAVPKLEGALEKRPLLNHPELIAPAQPILTNTVVQLAVSPAGATWSAVLLSSCGVTAADQEVLGYSKRVRFAPLKNSSGSAGEELQFGTVVVQWFQVRWDEPSLTTTAQR